MGTVEERLSYNEATLLKQGEAIVALRSDLARFEARVDTRFNLMESRFNLFESRLAALDDKMSRQFLWLVGMQMTTLIAIVGALIARG